MSYEYDSKINRELAKTALDIYKKSHNFVEVEDKKEKQTLNEDDKNELNSIINALLIEFVSTTIVATEQQAGKEFSEKEIQNLSEHILGNIEALSNEEKADFITELAQHAESHLLNESK